MRHPPDRVIVRCRPPFSIRGGRELSGFRKEVEAAGLRRGPGAGPHHRNTQERHQERENRARLPLHRAQGRRQDDDRPHPGQGAELREGSDSGSLPRMSELQGHNGRDGSRRPRDRRRQQPRHRRDQGSQGEGGLLRRRRPLEDLHHRRGARADQGCLQRPPQDTRGAASPGALRLRDHRAQEGPRDDSQQMPALRFQTHTGFADGRLSRPRSRRGGY